MDIFEQSTAVRNEFVSFFGKVIACLLPEDEDKKTAVLQYSAELMCLVAGNGKIFMFSKFFTDSVYSLTVGCRKYPKKCKGGDVRTINLFSIRFLCVADCSFFDCPIKILKAELGLDF